MANEIQIIAFELALAKKPIAMVSGATLGIYVAIRVWKLVRRAI